MLRLFTLAFCLLVASAPSRAADYAFDYTPGCAAAYKAYVSLRPDLGDALIRTELGARPANLMAVYIADYGDFLTLLFNGDPEQRTRRAPHEAQRLRLLQLASDDDPWKRLALAGIHLHWSLVRMRFGEQLRAATGFRRSYLLLRENESRFPAFAPTSVLYGAEEAIAGTIPEEYDWLLSIFGMKGNLTRGSARLAKYLADHPLPDAPLREEALIYDLYIRFYLGAGKEAAWKTVSSDALFDIRGNLMRAFIRANFALAYRKADAALAALQIAYATPGVQAYPVFDYEMGYTQLHRLSPSSTGYFDRYVARNAGKLYTKDALQAMALSWHLKGNAAKASSVRASILRQGSLLTDADRQAQRFAKGGRWPQPMLLSARMLIDGGYAPQALMKLRGTSAGSFADIADQLEYEFRLGRALEETGDASQAVKAYQRVIVGGRDRQEYFAARAALQMGGIYEQRGQQAEARRYYQLCLSMRDHDFQSSIDQQAKAGLSRVE